MKYIANFSKRFEKRYIKLLKRDKSIGDEFEKVLTFILEGGILPKKYKDHRLKGELEGYYDFHIKYDLVVIRYYKNKEGLVIFHDIGTHAQVFS